MLKSGMEVETAKRLKRLEEENRRLKKLLADAESTRASERNLGGGKARVGSIRVKVI